jgi:hypothetical protein
MERVRSQALAQQHDARHVFDGLSVEVREPRRELGGGIRRSQRIGDPAADGAQQLLRTPLPVHCGAHLVPQLGPRPRVCLPQVDQREHEGQVDEGTFVAAESRGKRTEQFRQDRFGPGVGVLGSVDGHGSSLQAKRPGAKCAF